MDKLEQYLDRVCRGIGGPRALRQHVRQELREHLLDAVAQHQAAGLSKEAALQRALEEFGAPEEVRSDLEATHGQRVMAVVIDKALQWKEMTMKAKWLWMSWAHVALVLVIVLQVMWITFANIFLVPKFQKLMSDGIMAPDGMNDAEVAWMVSFLVNVSDVGGHYSTWLMVLTAAAVGAFEWGVRSENKAFMRLSALGTAAVGLMVVCVLIAASLVIPYMLGAPATGRMARPYALEQIARTDAAVAAIDKALAKKDWEAMPEPADQASKALAALANMGPAIPSLLHFSGPPAAVEKLRGQVKTASDLWSDTQKAVNDKDAGRLESALTQFRKAFEPIQEASKLPPLR